MKKKILSTVSKIKEFVKREFFAISLLTYGVIAPINIASASGTSTATAESQWDNVIGFITPWIQRLGGVVILIGAVEFGLAWKNDDAEGKTKGMRTVIAGCIVWAVGMSSDIFLA